MTYEVVVSEFSYKGYEASITLSPGTYRFEVWGAEGGYNNYGGKGGYTAGTITIEKTVNVYIYVGGRGNDITGGWNGGGNGGEGSYYDEGGGWCPDGGGGGGATDIRIGSNNINNRIIIAGGGGGSCGFFSAGGAGGGIIGGEAYSPKTGKTTKGGSQTEGNILNGRSAIAACGGGQGADGCGGGGGGYRGGFADQTCGRNSNVGGGGGSSYISGHKDCIVNQEYVFTDISVQQNYHSGDGKAKITKFVTPTVPPKKPNSKFFAYNYLFL